LPVAFLLAVASAHPRFYIFPRRSSHRASLVWSALSLPVLFRRVPLLLSSSLSLHFSSLSGFGSFSFSLPLV
jgi:hypothetical protein